MSDDPKRDNKVIRPTPARGSAPNHVGIADPLRGEVFLDPSDAGRYQLDEAGKLQTPLDANGYARGMTALLALLAWSVDSSETDTNPTTHDGTTTHTVGRHYSGVAMFVTTAYAGGGSMTGQLQVSNDGTNWVSGSTTTHAITGNGTTVKAIVAADMAYKYHRWTWTKNLCSAWNCVITMSYNAG